MSEHTPGPWEIIGATEVAKLGEDWAIVAIICNPRPDGRPDDSLARPEPATIWNPRFDEACANARLIAAAPRLLADRAEAYRVLNESELQCKHLADDGSCENIDDCPYHFLLRLCEPLPEIAAPPAPSEAIETGGAR